MIIFFFSVKSFPFTSKTSQISSKESVEVINKAIDAGEKINLYFTGLCYDYCVYNCAKETATAHSVAQLPQTLTIIKDATVAIDPAAEPDMATYGIRVVTSADGDLVL